MITTYLPLIFKTINKDDYLTYLKKLDTENMINDLNIFPDHIKNGKEFYLGIFLNNNIACVSVLNITLKDFLFHRGVYIDKKIRGKNIREFSMAARVILADKLNYAKNKNHVILPLHRREKLWIRNGWKLFNRYKVGFLDPISEEEYQHLLKIDENLVFSGCYIKHEILLQWYIIKKFKKIYDILIDCNI